jgi:hypothetical protein
MKEIILALASIFSFLPPMNGTLLVNNRTKPARSKISKSLSLRDYWKMKTLATLREINPSKTPTNTQGR